MRGNTRFFSSLLICLTWPLLAEGLSEAERQAVDQISAQSLQGHLSFIASDLLEGRDTPSRGLDIAAEYIAAQFRRAGLKPGVQDSYFQAANWSLVDADMTGFRLSIEHGGQTMAIPKGRIQPRTESALALKAVDIVRLDPSESANWKSEQVTGKVVLLMPKTAASDRRSVARAMRQARATLVKWKPALVLTTLAGPLNRLRNPDEPLSYPSLAITDSGFRKVAETWATGAAVAKLTVTAKAPRRVPATLRNVIGVLPGSDPVLKDTYVLVTAHHDHVGMKRGGDGDTIYNGANDDGSGTVSVIEIASALAKLPRAPKRTIVFMTYFGEEKGLLGSRWYGKHPVFPVTQTVANLNLEQVGRTDAPGGSTVGKANVTGFDFSDVGKILHDAGAANGFVIEKDPNSDPFFARSDNQALADIGVPAHSIAAAYEYPDYHGLGDHWDKIDYDNMAKLDRVIAIAALRIANEPTKPAWNPDSTAAEKYRKAAAALAGQ